ncbi:MAG TPA: hypothetical protein VF375_03330 [Candidatus Limnocylindrales bacterium]
MTTQARAIGARTLISTTHSLMNVVRDAEAQAACRVCTHNYYRCHYSIAIPYGPVIVAHQTVLVGGAPNGPRNMA